MAAPSTIRLPRYTGPDAALRIVWDAMCRALESEMTTLRTPTGQPYAVSNGSGARALDVSTATAADAADALATLISDLKAKDVIA